MTGQGTEEGRDKWKTQRKQEQGHGGDHWLSTLGQVHGLSMAMAGSLSPRVLLWALVQHEHSKSLRERPRRAEARSWGRETA